MKVGVAIVARWGGASSLMMKTFAISYWPIGEVLEAKIGIFARLVGCKTKSSRTIAFIREVGSISFIKSYLIVCSMIPSPKVNVYIDAIQLSVLLGRKTKIQI